MIKLTSHPAEKNSLIKIKEINTYIKTISINLKIKIDIQIFDV